MRTKQRGLAAMNHDFSGHDAGRRRVSCGAPILPRVRPARALSSSQKNTHEVKIR